MGKFDNNSEERKTAYLYKLCNEIITENQGKDKVAELEVSEVMNKFTNSRKSGIIDHLAEIGIYEEDFDLEQWCKFLKLYFYYEKIGKNKSDLGDGKEKTKFTKIIAKPALENVPSIYSDSTLYGEAFDEFKKAIAKEIGEEKAATRERKLKHMDAEWEADMAKIMLYAYREDLVEHKEMSEFDLKNINRYMKEQILDKLEQPIPDVLKPKEGIFETFYNILIMHELICDRCERIDSYDKLVIPENLTDEYTKLFNEMDRQGLNIDVIPEVLRQVKTMGNHELVKKIRFLIFVKDELNDTEIKSLGTAEKYYSVLVKWLKDIKDGDNKFEQQIPISWLIAVIQEIIYCKENQITVKNEAYGIPEARRKLIAVLKHPETAESKHVQMWLIRIENRYGIDFGGNDLLRLERSAEEKYLEIRKWMLQFYNLDDILFVHSALEHFLHRNAYPRYVAGTTLDLLQEKCMNKMKIYVHTYFPQMFDLGRELFLDSNQMKVLIKDLKRNVDKCNKHKGDLFKDQKMYLTFHYPERESCKFMLMYNYVKSLKRVNLMCFRAVGEDEIINQYFKYGLNSFGVGTETNQDYMGALGIR